MSVLVDGVSKVFLVKAKGGSMSFEGFPNEEELVADVLRRVAFQADDYKGERTMVEAIAGRVLAQIDADEKRDSQAEARRASAHTTEECWPCEQCGDCGSCYAEDACPYAEDGEHQRPPEDR